MRVLCLFLLLILSFPAISQRTIWKSSPEGYYEGAIIRGNSVALLTADFYYEQDTLRVESNIKEWTYYVPFKSNVEINQNALTFGTYFGEVNMVFDSLYTEMIGNTKTASPAYEVHLKKVRRPPAPSLEIKEMDINVGDINLKANVVIPSQYKQPLACAIYVQGRGCRDRNVRLERAKVLAQYGIIAVTFDKRGAKGTDFDCDETTIDLHTDDLIKVTEAISQLEEVDETKIGYIAGSYGGWVAPRAAAKTNQEIAFIVSKVGAATSIKQQQLDNAVYYTKERLGGDTAIIRQIQEYTLLEYESEDDEATFKKMTAMLELAEKNNWKRILSKSDIPQKPEDLKGLWVRRNQYDPSQDLKNYKGAFLSILGEKDRVVPWKENSKRFEELFQEAGKENYRILIIPGAPHRLEHGNVLRDLRYSRALKSSNFYLKFDRVVPGVMEEVIVFLKDYGFIN